MSDKETFIALVSSVMDGDTPCGVLCDFLSEHGMVSRALDYHASYYAVCGCSMYGIRKRVKSARVHFCELYGEACRFMGVDVCQTKWGQGE